MKCYADSSFLVSCYLLDRNTVAAKAWLSRAGVPLPFTTLHQLEVRNAFQLGIFRQLITPSEVQQAIADLQSDLIAGRLVRTKVNWAAAMRLSATLSEKHAAATGTRSLDILHVAAAKSLRTREFVSFDARQRLLANIAGLNTSP